MTTRAAPTLPDVEKHSEGFILTIDPTLYKILSVKMSLQKEETLDNKIYK